MAPFIDTPTRPSHTHFSMQSTFLHRLANTSPSYARVPRRVRAQAAHIRPAILPRDRCSAFRSIQGPALSELLQTAYLDLFVLFEDVEWSAEGEGHGEGEGGGEARILTKATSRPNSTKHIYFFCTSGISKPAWPRRIARVAIYSPVAGKGELYIVSACGHAKLRGRRRGRRRRRRRMGRKGRRGSRNQG